MKDKKMITMTVRVEDTLLDQFKEKCSGLPTSTVIRLLMEKIVSGELRVNLGIEQENKTAHDEGLISGP